MNALSTSSALVSRAALALFAAACVRCVCLAAQEPAGSLAEATVLAAENARCSAVLQRDGAALAKMMTADVSYVHADGFVEDNRDTYIANVMAGKHGFHAFHIKNSFVRIYGKVAVTHGVFIYERPSAGSVISGSLIYTAVYRHAGDAWLLEAWQTTKKAD